MRAAIVWPLGAAIGIGGGHAAFHFFMWVQANGIQDWQVAGLFVAIVAALGLVADRLMRRSESGGTK